MNVDADWNEQNDIQFHYEQTFLQDIIGKNGTLAVDGRDGFRVLENLSFALENIGQNKEFKTFLRTNLGLSWLTDELNLDLEPATNESGEAIIEDKTHSVAIITDPGSAACGTLTVCNDVVYKFTATPEGEPTYLETSWYVVGKGNYYVDGILCENDYDVAASRQPDLQMSEHWDFFLFEWGAVPGKYEDSIKNFLKGRFTNLDWLDENATFTKSTVSGTDTIEIKSGDELHSATITLGTGVATYRNGADFYSFTVKEEVSGEETERNVYYTVNNPALPSNPENNHYYLAYLDVFEKHVTHLEDDYIQEKALGDVDTATRTKIAWQVKLVDVTDRVTDNEDDEYKCIHVDNWDDFIPSSATGRLEARAKPSSGSDDKCSLYESAGYTSLENQLYRVEVHNPGDLDHATFKWSRDNGTIVAKVDAFKISENKIKIRKRGKDTRHDFLGNQWIEVTDELHESLGKPGTLVKISDVNGETLEYDPDTTIGDPITEENYPLIYKPKVRRWESRDGSALISASEDLYIELEQGVEIQLTAGSYRTGDYWLIPARTRTGNVEWPPFGRKETDEPYAIPPMGIQHHYAPLALLQYKDEDSSLNFVTDCRSFFSSLTELMAIHYVGGDGQEALPKDTLPAPLRVGVTIGQTPINNTALKNAKVRFTITGSEWSGLQQSIEGSPSGPLENMLDVTTNDESVAECWWTLFDPQTEEEAQLDQQVKAELLDDCGNPIDLVPIYFNATLPISFYYISGDGEEAVPNSEIDLTVGLTIGNTPVTSGTTYQVKFHVESGDGSLSDGENSENEVTVSPGAGGIASCKWTLDGTTLRQQAYAELILEDGTPTNLPRIYFNSMLPVCFYYIKGDGQTAIPGNDIELAVGLKIGDGTEFSDYKVNFEVRGEGSGILYPEGLVPFTNGVAGTIWTVGDDFFNQQVVATLYFKDQPTNLQPIYFNTALPISFYYIKGDGEEALPGSDIDLEVDVRVKADVMLPDDIQFEVKFVTVQNSGSISPSEVRLIDVPAKATWSLSGTALRQQAYAELYYRKYMGPEDAETPWTKTNLPPIYFNATLPISFYYISGDGEEGFPGSEIDLKVGLTMGKDSLPDDANLWYTNYAVKFTVQSEDSGSVNTDDWVLFNLNGTAEVTWRLGNSPKQQVYAELYYKTETETPWTKTNLPPIYFNATLRCITAANTGIVTLLVPIGAEFPLVFGPFKHFLDVDVPPAILLGFLTLEDPKKGEFNPNQVWFMDNWLLGNIQIWFKAVRINTDTFKIWLWAQLPTTVPPIDHKPAVASSSSRSDSGLREAISPSTTTTDTSAASRPTYIAHESVLTSTRVTAVKFDTTRFEAIKDLAGRLDTGAETFPLKLRWWAVPAEDREEQSSGPIEDQPHEEQAPTIAFDRPLYSEDNQNDKAIVTVVDPNLPEDNKIGVVHTYLTTTDVSHTKLTKNFFNKSTSTGASVLLSLTETGESSNTYIGEMGINVKQGLVIVDNTPFKLAGLTPNCTIYVIYWYGPTANRKYIWAEAKVGQQ